MPTSVTSSGRRPKLGQGRPNKSAMSSPCSPDTRSLSPSDTDASVHAMSYTVREHTGTLSWRKDAALPTSAFAKVSKPLSKSLSRKKHDEHTHKPKQMKPDARMLSLLLHRTVSHDNLCNKFSSLSADHSKSTLAVSVVQSMASPLLDTCMWKSTREMETHLLCFCWPGPKWERGLRSIGGQAHGPVVFTRNRDCGGEGNSESPCAMLAALGQGLTAQVAFCPNRGPCPSRKLVPVAQSRFCRNDKFPYKLQGTTTAKSD